MPNLPLVLIVEDDIPLGKAYMAFLQDEPCHLQHISNGADALLALDHNKPDVLILDLLLPDMHGQEILDHIQEQSLPVTTIVVTTEASTDAAVKAIKSGAQDYLVKPLDADRLQTTVHNILQKLKLERRLQSYEDLSPEGFFEGMTGESPAMQIVYRIIDNASRSEASIFITGESGTGKELCAEAIHRRSARSDGPFTAINCAAIPHDLMESELFGHVKGAFTGATADRKGAAAQADGGTLFFDEVCELNLKLQAKLLRFIQTCQFQPVGASKIENTNVRFVCATNRKPWDEVKAGRFREDLYYRLHVVPINMPPLRERENDIFLLAKNFLDSFSLQQEKHFDGFSEESQQKLLKYNWPGNVRELQNVIHNLVILNEGGLIQPNMVQLIHSIQEETSLNGQFSPPASVSSRVRPLWREEQDIIERAVRFCDGNISEAANLLGISDSTIYRKRQKWEQEN